MIDGEPPPHPGEEEEPRNHDVIGSFGHTGKQGGTECIQNRYQGPVSVVRSGGVHERGP